MLPPKFLQHAVVLQTLAQVDINYELWIQTIAQMPTLLLSQQRKKNKRKTNEIDMYLRCNDISVKCKTL
jgi:hypothetical protein